MDFSLKVPGQLRLHFKSLRKVAGFSQAELAALLGVSQSRVAAIEKDPAAVSVGQFLAILKLLNAELLIRQEDSARNHSSVAVDAAENQNLTALTPPGLVSYTPSRLTPKEIVRSAGSTTAADTAKRQVQKNTTLRPQNLPVDWQNKKPKGSW